MYSVLMVPHQELVYKLWAPSGIKKDMILIPKTSHYYPILMRQHEFEDKFRVWQAYEHERELTGLDDQVLKEKPRAMQLARQLDLLDAIIPFLIGIPLFTVLLVATRNGLLRSKRVLPRSLAARILTFTGQPVAWYILVSVVVTAMMLDRSMADSLILIPLQLADGSDIWACAAFMVALGVLLLLVCKSLDTVGRYVRAIYAEDRKVAPFDVMRRLCGMGWSHWYIQAASGVALLGLGFHTVVSIAAKSNWLDVDTSLVVFPAIVIGCFGWILDAGYKWVRRKLQRQTAEEVKP